MEDVSFQMRFDNKYMAEISVYLRFEHKDITNLSI